MKDSGTVVRLEDGVAWVKVTPKIACCDCSARALCTNRQDEEGKLAARNPVGALPGDEVEIEVPESDYSRALSGLFALLLAVSLAGLMLGYLLRPVGSTAPAVNGLIGFFVGLGLSGLLIRQRYRSGRAAADWPVVRAIIRKGGSHG